MCLSTPFVVDYAAKQAHVELAERMKKRDAGQSNLFFQL